MAKAVWPAVLCRPCERSYRRMSYGPQKQCTTCTPAPPRFLSLRLGAFCAANAQLATCLLVVQVRCQAAGVGVGAVVRQLAASRSLATISSQLYAGVWSASTCSVFIGEQIVWGPCSTSGCCAT
jgi:hypothetical protein